MADLIVWWLYPFCEEMFGDVLNSFLEFVRLRFELGGFNGCVFNKECILSTYCVLFRMTEYCYEMNPYATPVRRLWAVESLLVCTAMMGDSSSVAFDKEKLENGDCDEYSRKTSIAEVWV